MGEAAGQYTIARSGEAARREKEVIGQVVIANRVGIGPTGGGKKGLAVERHIQMPGAARAEAEALVQMASAICPYSNAIRGNIPVQLIVEEPETVLKANLSEAGVGCD